MEHLYCQNCDQYLGCPIGVAPRCICCGWEQPKADEEE